MKQKNNKHMDADLSGVYFRSQRNGKWMNLCFEDLPEEEQQRIVESKSQEWNGSLAVIMAKTLKNLVIKLNEAGIEVGNKPFENEG
jgi:hypothetical protein